MNLMFEQLIFLQTLNNRIQSSTLHDWIRFEVPAKEFEKVKNLPEDILEPLYEETVKFGPNHENAQRFLTDIKNFVEQERSSEEHKLNPSFLKHCILLPDRLQPMLRLMLWSKYPKIDVLTRSLLDLVIISGILDGDELMWLEEDIRKLDSQAQHIGIRIQDYKWSRIND